MNITGEYTFNVPRPVVWEALRDPHVLAAVVPTCWGVETIGENEYSGVLLFQIGSMKGVFKGNIKLSNLVAPERYDVVVRGSGIRGVVQIKGSMTLTTIASNTTRMQYSGQVHIGGRMASVGSRVLESAVRSLVNQSFDALDAYLVKKVSPL